MLLTFFSIESKCVPLSSAVQERTLETYLIRENIVNSNIYANVVAAVSRECFGKQDPL